MAMQVIRDGLKLCEDCRIAAVNGDFTGLDYHYGSGLDKWGRKIGPSADERMAEITAGLERLGPHLVAADSGEDGEDGYDSFSRTPCACCETRLAGARWDFAILGEVNATPIVATIGCPTCRAWTLTIVKRSLTPPSPDSSCSDCGAQEIAVYTAIAASS